jgi:hypothetical protein
VQSIPVINEPWHYSKLEKPQGEPKPWKEFADLCCSASPPSYVMKLTIISQNLQGLNDLVKVDVVRNYYRPLLSSVDIVCF